MHIFSVWLKFNLLISCVYFVYSFLCWLRKYGRTTYKNHQNHNHPTPPTTTPHRSTKIIKTTSILLNKTLTSCQLQQFLLCVIH